MASFSFRLRPVLEARQQAQTDARLAVVESNRRLDHAQAQYRTHTAEVTPRGAEVDLRQERRRQVAHRAFRAEHQRLRESVRIARQALDISIERFAEASRSLSAIEALRDRQRGIWARQLTRAAARENDARNAIPANETDETW